MRTLRRSIAMECVLPFLRVLLDFDGRTGIDEGQRLAGSGGRFNLASRQGREEPRLSPRARVRAVRVGVGVLTKLK